MKSLYRKVFALLLVVITMFSATGVAVASSHATVDIQILNVSDWHGQLDPLSVGTSQIGGAAVLAAYFQAERAANPNTLTLTAGDAVGATPPVSSFFQDVPTIQAMNMMGFQVDTFGNHNFDGGIARLQNQINLANFQYVSANLLNRNDNLSGVKDFEIFNVGGVKVAVIGITNPEAPTLVFPGNFGTIVPTDPIKAALKARDKAEDQDADIMVVICHMGVTGFDATGAPFGPLIDFANAINKPGKKHPKIDVIIGDHTDIQFSGIINGALVYENRSKGLTYAKANLTVDAENHKIINQSVAFISPVASMVTPDPAIAAMVASYRTQLAPFLNTLVGSSSRIIPRADACGQSAGRTCESLIGNVVTDSMRSRYGVDFALTNSGGLRANLTCPTTDSATDFCPPFTPPPFPITRGQVLTVLPFGNVVVTLSINGAELKTMLENGISKMPAVDGRFPQVSGLCFNYDIAAPVGSRVTGAVRQATDGTCSGAAVDLTAASTYTIAENDFMANGGDGYLNLASRMVTREIMDQVLADYITASGVISPSIQGRVVCTTGGAPACPVVTP
jgi:2',3'-cyclic-nucleotide 2'-phosphodiesterase (5'-nucleotidase family)